MSLRRTPKAERLPYIAIGLGAALVTLLVYFARPGFVAYMDLKAFDAMAAARGVVPAPTEIVIVAVDEKSVNELGRWPWPRKTTARLVERLAPAKVLAVDMVFSEAEGPAADTALAGAIGRSGNVVLGYFFRNDSTAQADPEAAAQIKRSSVQLVRFAGGRAPGGGGQGGLPVHLYSGVEPNIPEVGRNALSFGSFNILPDPDGIYRSTPLVYGYEGRLYPVLALEAARLFFGDTLMVDVEEYGFDGIHVNERLLPVDETGGLLLSYYGPAATFATLSASDVLAGRAPPEAIKDRLVFLGVTEKAVYDIRPTPVDPAFPGVEIQATIAGNILEARHVIHDTRATLLDVLLVLLFPFVLAGALSYMRSTMACLALYLGFSVACVAIEYLLFAGWSVRTGVVFPAAALLISYTASEAYRNIVVEKRSRYLRKAFSSYVSGELVAEILKDPDRLKLGGEKREVTVLFSDIRGFTSVSERLAPEELVSLLNGYLSPMTRIILDEGGTLDKYIGDAIMAVFNAPVDVPGHPARACAAALKMAATLKVLNAAWKEAGLDGVQAGVGITTGMAVVGNMGTELRFDYTVIGDTVNLASRLEGLTKLYSVGVITGAKTRQAAGAAFLFRELDVVRVKGRHEGEVVYELMGEPGPENEALAEEFAAALALYRRRRFEEAREAFRTILETHPGDGPSGLYIRRCDEFIEEPPPDDWDGTYEAVAK